MTTIGRTMIRQRSVNMIGAGGNKISAEATAWQAAVIANGGTVSAPRLAIVNTFIKAEKSAGTWALTDDYWGLWGENSAQALTSLKQLRLATAPVAPVHTVDRGYAFNGTTQYLDSGFVPSTHFAAMTGSNMRLAVYERANVATGGQAAGVTHTGTRNIAIIPRNASDNLTATINHAVTIMASGITDSRGLSASSRSAAPVFAGYKNGSSSGPVVPGSNGTLLPSAAMFMGCHNGGTGTPGLFRPTSLGFVCVGASLSAAQEAAQYTNVQAWATAVGANV